MVDRIRTILILLAAAAGGREAGGQTAGADAVHLQSAVQVIEAPIRTVKVYPAGAMVTREAEVKAGPGEYVVVIEGLPETVAAQTLWARIIGTGTVMDVDVRTRPADAVDPAAAARDVEIRQLRAKLGEVTDRLEVLSEQDGWLKRLGEQTAAATRPESASLDRIEEQFGDISQRRTRVLREIRGEQAEYERLMGEVEALERRQSAKGAEAQRQAAVVRVSLADAGAATLAVSYYVSQAGWKPSYMIRSSEDWSTVSVEAVAMVSQSSGEAWGEAEVSLSTFQPSSSIVPALAAPWYVDVATGENGWLSSQTDPAPAAPGPEESAVFYTGPAEEYVLPGKVSVSSSGNTQRMRMWVFESAAAMVHFAVPYVSPNVYMRAEIENTGGRALLPGTATVFAGSRYVGVMELPLIQPGREFNVYFGIDRGVGVSRQLVDRSNSNTGLLGGGRRITSNFKFILSNATDRPVSLELWDRIPASRSEDIRVELDGLSNPLATDSYYVRNQMPQGLLKWRLTLSPNSHGESAGSMTYTLRIDHGKNVEMTPLPD